MAEVLYIERWKRENSTLGVLNYAGFSCFTLELPWLDNARNISCIPEGIYDAVKYDSPTHGDVVLILEVPQRSMIEIHAGNFTSDILGCVLVGDAIKFLNNDDIPDVTNSRSTLKALLNKLPSAFKVNIS